MRLCHGIRKSFRMPNRIRWSGKPWGSDGGRALPLFRQAYPDRKVPDLLRADFIFRAPEIPYIAKRSRLNDCTWSYLFNMDQPIDGGNTPWHCSDIPYVFHNIDLVEYPGGPGGGSPGAEGSGRSLPQVIAFAKTGNPNNETIPSWPASRGGEG